MTIGAVVGGPVTKIAVPALKILGLVIPKKKKRVVHGPYLKEGNTMIAKLLGLVKGLMGSDPNGKPLYLSMTVLVNTAIGLGSLFYPPLSAWILAHPDTAMQIMAGINILLRIRTKGKITLNK